MLAPLPKPDEHESSGLEGTEQNSPTQSRSADMARLEQEADVERQLDGNTSSKSQTSRKSSKVQSPPPFESSPLSSPPPGFVEEFEAQIQDSLKKRKDLDQPLTLDCEERLPVKPEVQDQIEVSIESAESQPPSTEVKSTDKVDEIFCNVSIAVDQTEDAPKTALDSDQYLTIEEAAARVNGNTHNEESATSVSEVPDSEPERSASGASLKRKVEPLDVPADAVDSALENSDKSPSKKRNVTPSRDLPDEPPTQPEEAKEASIVEETMVKTRSGEPTREHDESLASSPAESPSTRGFHSLGAFVDFDNSDRKHKRGRRPSLIDGVRRGFRRSLSKVKRSSKRRADADDISEDELSQQPQSKVTKTARNSSPGTPSLTAENIPNGVGNGVPPNPPPAYEEVIGNEVETNERPKRAKKTKANGAFYNAHGFAGDNDADEEFSEKRKPVYKRGGKRAAAQEDDNPKIPKPWQLPQVLTSDRSPLLRFDILKILKMPEAWDLLPAEGQHRVLEQIGVEDAELMDDGKYLNYPAAMLDADERFKNDVGKFKEDLECGRLDVDWILEAEDASKARVAGDFDIEIEEV